MEVSMKGVKLEIREITNGWLLKIENYLKIVGGVGVESETYFKTLGEVWDYISKAHPRMPE